MKQTIIPAGYRLTVKSWENDADNYKTVVVEGLSKAKCAFYADLCKQLKHSSDYNNRICNLYEPSEKELKRVAAVLRQVAQRHSADVTEFDNIDDEELLLDQGTDILYDLGLTGDFYTRVCSEWKVEHIPVQLVLTDVTEEFK